LRVHHLVGTVVDPVVPLTEPKGTTTVTPAEIIYHRRVRLPALADELGNVAQACRQMGISRTRFYEWRKIVADYGIDALMPKAHRCPQLPNATPTHIVEDLLTLAVVEPTLGCRQYADRLAERGYQIGKTTVQKHSSTMAWAGERNASPEQRRSPPRQRDYRPMLPATASRSGSATTAPHPGIWWRWIASISAT
jgi:hypothetical protein